MPALLEDPQTRIPPPSSHALSAPLLSPIHKTLKDSTTPVTLYPITQGPSSIPTSLLKYLHGEFNAEIERGSTYPMEEKMSFEVFTQYWFGTFAVVALLDGEGVDVDVRKIDEGNPPDWEKVSLGCFYIKPNYPGRCSHICNAGFFTTPAARNRGVGMIMGQAYLEFAPKLGYKSSVFNLVFENNIASIKIWEKLGFRVIGRVPEAARLANSETLVDALIYGRRFD